MKSISSRIFLVFAAFYALAFESIASAGLWDKFITQIQAYIGDPENQAPLDLECPLDEKVRIGIRKDLNTLRSLDRLQIRQAVGLIRTVCDKLFIVKKMYQYPEAYPCATALFQSIEFTTRLSGVDSYLALLEQARVYFENLDGVIPESIQFRPKDSGAQLGAIVSLRLDGQAVTYYLKTHRGGLKNDYSVKAKAVDPYELFVYSFLEFSGYGPEVHFLLNGAKNVFIATKHIGQPSKEKLCPLPVFTYGQLQGGHLELLYITDKSQERRSVNPVVVEELVCVDIISRILGLSDTIANKENICFVGNREGTQLVKFQIIDFSLIDQYLTARYDPHCLFSSFEQGNGNYHGIDDIAYYFLSTRAKEKRISYARDLFTVAGFIRWIDEAEAKVTPLLEALNQAESEREEGTPIDLERFHRLVEKARRNAEVFLRALGAAED